MSFSGKLLSFTGLFALGISTAFGQGVLESLVDCSTQKNDSARLACFDREVAKLAPLARSVAPAQVSPASVPPSPPVVATTPAQAAPTPSDDFGVSGNLARQRAETKKEADSGPRELHATITGVKAKPYGELVMELDNGQVWEQPEKKNTFLIRTGEKVVITKHALGSYFLTADSGATTRVRRIR
jgi:hypothetical protein